MTFKLMMKDRLKDAMSEAEKVNPRALLVSVFGLGLHPDGTVRLGEPDDYFSRWQYAFCDDMGGEEPPQYITVIYMCKGEPMVDSNAGNVIHTVPFEDDIVDRLANSGRIVDIFQRQPGHKKMKGTDNDCIIYYMERMMAPIAVLANWKNQMLRVDPVELEVI